LVIFYCAINFSSKPVAQLSLPTCSSLASSVTPNPGVNCSYYGLPLCNTISPPSSIKHRINCADLIDLPLCSDIVLAPGVSALPGRNCVELCSNAAYGNPDPEADPALVRGIDYAVFNRDCIRFCDDVEPGIIARVGSNCVQRSCHQLSASDPNPGVNCNLLKCNLLTADELNKAKFEDETKKYCDGDNLKCYSFSQDKLPYLRQRNTNPMCIIHNCTPETASCGPDDVLNVTNQGSSYTAVYDTYINAGLDITSKAFCRRLDCEPIVRSQYRCTVNGTTITGDDTKDIVLNSSCDTTEKHLCTYDGTNISGNATRDIIPSKYCDASGAGANCVYNATDKRSYCYQTLSCASNYCVKIIDCNLTANKTKTECLVATNTEDDSSNNVDPFKSWFYRPKPSDAAIDKNGLIWPMKGDYCYSGESDFYNGLHRWGSQVPIFFNFFTGKVIYAWFHSSWIDSVRSPGACRTNHDGNRGTGYVYMCGTDGLLYNKPTGNAKSDVAYFQGYATTDFSSSIAKHKVTVCVRFKNTLCLSACGKRECGVNAWFDSLTSQACGGDVCRDLYVSDGNETECLMNESLANGSGGDCAATIDTYLRVRAVKYEDRICAFLDSKGQFAYNGMFIDGSGSISFENDDGIHRSKVCMNDLNSTDGSVCKGFDSNSTKESASKWRALQLVHYVDNNRPSSSTVKGYLDRAGKLYREQVCPKVTLKLPPPDLYNLANITNSEKLFTPPIRIRNSVKIRGGEDSIIPAGEVYGKTDFHFPEIRVQFGSNVFRMSLGMGYSGYEKESESENYTLSPSFTTSTTIFNGKSYSVELFVRKEFFYDIGSPQFCLYRKIKNQKGLYIDPIRIGCVDRIPPYPDSASYRAVDGSVPVRKTLIYPRATNTYDNSKIVIRYLDGGADNVANNCSGDDKCTAELELTNSDYTQPFCSQDLENHRICVKREECSAIYIECIKNEISINNALNNNEDVTQFMSLRQTCNSTIVPACNKKLGINLASGNIFNSVPDPSAIDPLAYGWFNELCVVSGFEKRLKKVIAHTTDNGAMGKCIISAASPYLTDGNPATNCDSGGRAPYCLCQEAPLEYVPIAKQEIRTQTPREAGLCIDMPLPSYCPAIDYNPNPSANPSDPEYILSSIGKSLYNNVSGVHLSHQDRSLGAVSGYAEFAKSLPGMDDVRGQCNGFWTYDRNSSGVILPPLQSCIGSNDGTASWDKSVRNRCVRYSCPDVFTAGPNVQGTYQGGYSVNEVSEARGSAHGFATWVKYTKTNDFPEIRTASSCIPGFKAVGSSPVISSGLITRYVGGNLPTRQCDQLGNWGTPSNICERISCPAIAPAKPLSAADTSLWVKWYNNGGATYPSVFASRSQTRIQAESVSYGTCDESLGFFQTGPQPKRECDYLGNWGPVINPCTTSCSAISNSFAASQPNNGFATWLSAQGISLASGPVSGNFFASCVNGYIKNPYPPASDDQGNPLPLAVANDLTRPAENPKRVCRPDLTDAQTIAGVWGPVIGGCINKCPGAEEDPRVGVGITRHAGRSGEIEIRWPSTAFGEYAYKTNWSPPGIESMFSGAQFAIGRTNGYYLVRRYCNPNGKWSDAEPMCSANNVQIGNAKYFNSSAPSGYKNSIAPSGRAGSIPQSSDRVTGVCVNSSYWNSNRNTSPAPKMACVFATNASGAIDPAIDRVYLTLADGTSDCELKSCPSYPGSLGLFSSIPKAEYAKTDARFLVGGQISGFCLNNEKNSLGSVVYTLKSLLEPSPYISCQENGQWSAVQSETSCKKSCTLPNRSYYIDPKDCGSGRTRSFEATTLQHGQVIEFNAYSTCGDGVDDCDGWKYYAICNDGVLFESSLGMQGKELCTGCNQSGTRCPYSKYENGNWTPAVSIRYSRNTMYRVNGITQDLSSGGVDYIDGNGLVKKFVVR